MNEDNFVEELKAKISRAYRLLDDPHPGLFTWNRALVAAMDDVVKAWTTETSDQKRG